MWHKLWAGAARRIACSLTMWLRFKDEISRILFACAAVVLRCHFILDDYLWRTVRPTTIASTDHGTLIRVGFTPSLWALSENGYQVGLERLFPGPGRL